MGWFKKKEKKITVRINEYLEMSFTAEDVRQIIAERNSVREHRDQLRDDLYILKCELSSLKERLQKANAKLKDYGHPGEGF